MVSGTATYRERMALPQGAVFAATLEDVSRADAPAIVIREYRKEDPGNPPFQFTIPYDPAQIVTNHIYVVRARVTVQGHLLFTSSERKQVLTLGHGSEIGEMIVMQHVPSGSTTAKKPATPAGEISTADLPLEGTLWKLTELNGKPVKTTGEEHAPNLIFHAKEKRVSGSGGCNRIMGGYMVRGESIHFNGVASTMMACQHGMDTEQAFLAALQKVQTWKLDGSSLSLSDGSGTVLAKLTASLQK